MKIKKTLNKESVMCVQCKYQTRYETRNTIKTCVQHTECQNFQTDKTNK